MDFRKQGGVPSAIYIDWTAVEKVESFKFLGIDITDKLKWTTHTQCDGGPTEPLQPQEAKDIWLVT